MLKQRNPDDITISDILQLALPVKTAVLSGKAHSRRVIHWISLLISWNDLTSQVQAGDLVIIPPHLQKQFSEHNLQQKLQEIAQQEAIGVLFFADVTKQVVETANQLSLTLLVTPPQTPLRDIHRDLTTLMVDRQYAIAERGMQLYRKLAEMSREEQGLDVMTQLISKITGKIVIVQDKRLDVKSSSAPPDNNIDMPNLISLLSQRERLPSVLRNRKNAAQVAAEAEESYWQQILPIEGVGRLVSPIISGDRARGYLSLIGIADELDLLDNLAVEHGAAVFALEMAKAKAVSEAKKALRGNFLEGLLSGTLPAKEIARLEGRLDHKTERPHAIITAHWIEVKGTKTPSLRRLETAVNWLLRNHTRNALVHIYAEQHICIFQALTNEADMQSAHRLARRLQEHIQKESPSAKLIIGISGPAITLSDWPLIYEESLQAMKLGERLQLNKVVEFSSLGVYRLLGQLEEIQTVREFIEEVIGPLAQYDKQHNSNLVHTVDAYFTHHGNISKTAEAMFIHRNTLLYRLERIQGLTKHNLNQSNMRLALHLSLKLWQLRPDK